jgi:hypothetical protein
MRRGSCRGLVGAVRATQDRPQSAWPGAGATAASGVPSRGPASWRTRRPLSGGEVRGVPGEVGPERGGGPGRCEALPVAEVCLCATRPSPAGTGGQRRASGPPGRCRHPFCGGVRSAPGAARWDGDAVPSGSVSRRSVIRVVCSRPGGRRSRSIGSRMAGTGVPLVSVRSSGCRPLPHADALASSPDGTTHDRRARDRLHRSHGGWTPADARRGGAGRSRGQPVPTTDGRRRVLRSHGAINSGRGSPQRSSATLAGGPRSTHPASSAPGGRRRRRRAHLTAEG